VYGYLRFAFYVLHHVSSKSAALGVPRTKLQL
jgi:hypothetical protein